MGRQLAGKSPPRPEIMGLLQACKEVPEDDTPRLVLADWLEEHGDPARAECIRVQCALATDELAKSEREALKRRRDQIRRQHEKAWLRPFAKLTGARRGFDRGLIQIIVEDAQVFLSDSVQALAGTEAWAWVEQLTFRIKDWLHGRLRFKDWPRLLASPLLQVPKLTIWKSPLGHEGAKLLGEAPHTGHLRELELWGTGIGDEGTAALAAASAVSKLTSLALVYDHGVGPKGTGALADSPHLSQLRKLNLSGNKIGDAGADALAASPHLARLTSLNLGAIELGPAGAAALARSRHLVHLTEFDLGHNAIGDKGAEALADSSNLKNVVRLELTGNSIGEKGIAALAASPHLGQLRELILDQNRFGDAGAAALAASPILRNLRRLGLRSTEISDDGARALAASQHMNRSMHLRLIYNSIGPKAKALLRREFKDLLL
jgi:uncharacterized protein (TIGR02996 family)